MRDPAATGQPTPVENGASTPSGAPPPVRPEQVWLSLTLSVSSFNVQTQLRGLRLCSSRHSHGGMATRSWAHGHQATALFFSFFFFSLLIFSLSFFFLFLLSSFFFS
jgi:hypothetical protein